MVQHDNFSRRYLYLPKGCFHGLCSILASRVRMILWMHKNSLPPQLPNCQHFVGITTIRKHASYIPTPFPHHFPNQHNDTMGLTPNEAPSLWELGCPVMWQRVWRVAKTTGGFQWAVHFSYSIHSLPMILHQKENWCVMERLWECLWDCINRLDVLPPSSGGVSFAWPLHQLTRQDEVPIPFFFQSICRFRFPHPRDLQHTCTCCSIMSLISSRVPQNGLWLSVGWSGGQNLKCSQLLTKEHMLKTYTNKKP